MTCCAICPPDDPALRTEYDGAYTWTRQWVRHESDDSVQDELFAVRDRLSHALSPVGEASARGALKALLEHLNDPTCGPCDAAGKVA